MKLENQTCLKILMRSRGAVSVLEVMPAIPPATKCFHQLEEEEEGSCIFADDGGSCSSSGGSCNGASGSCGCSGSSCSSISCCFEGIFCGGCCCGSDFWGRGDGCSGNGSCSRGDWDGSFCSDDCCTVDCCDKFSVSCSRDDCVLFFNLCGNGDEAEDGGENIADLDFDTSISFVNWRVGNLFFSYLSF